MNLTLTISDTVATLLATLDDAGNVQHVLEKLIDHAQQGVYRPGAWEREWLVQAFGDEFTTRLAPGDPHGRTGCEHIFHRPSPSAPPAPAGEFAWFYRTQERDHVIALCKGHAYLAGRGWKAGSGSLHPGPATGCCVCMGTATIPRMRRAPMKP